MCAVKQRVACDAVSAVVFDFDGLLMDTESTSLASWRYEWSQWGLSLDEGRFFADHGGDITEERYAELAAAVGPSYDREASHARRTAYRDRLHQELGLAAGISRWIVPNPFADRARFGEAALVLASAAEMSLSRALSSLA